MAEAATKLPVKSEEKKGEDKGGALAQTWRPFESLRREVDRLSDRLSVTSVFPRESMPRRSMPASKRACLP